MEPFEYVMVLVSIIIGLAIAHTRHVRRLTWRGRWALGLFSIHVVLLFVPPLPPFWRGSLWDYALSAGAVLLGVLEVNQAALPLRAWWGRLGVGLRLLLGYGAAALLLAIGSVLYVLAPAAFARFSSEQGVWEPLSLFLLIGATIVLVRSARAEDSSASSSRWLTGSFFALAAAEEIDYLGLFSPFIGRVEGLYLGSPHDLFRFWTEGVAPPAIAAIIALPALVAIAILWRFGHLRPAALRPLARPLPVIWFVSAAVLMGLAMAEEAHLVGLPGSGPSPEELLETTAAVLLSALALEVAAHRPG